MYATQNPDPTQQMPASTPVPPVQPAAPPNPVAKKKASIDILKNLVAGKPPVGPVEKDKTAGWAPAPGTAAHAQVQNNDDPTQDPNNPYYGVSPDTLASYRAAQTQADQYQQAIQKDANAPQPTAPQYTAPTEDHVGRRNTAQIATGLLALLLGPGRHGSGPGNFLGALSGGLGTGRKQLMSDKTEQAKDKFKGQEDQYKTQVEQGDKKQTADISLANHADSNVDRVRGQIEAQHKVAVAAKEEAQKRKDQLDHWADENKVNKAKFQFELSKYKDTKSNVAWDQTYKTRSQEELAQHQHVMEGIAMTNSRLHAESVDLQAKSLAFREAHQNKPETLQQKEQIRIQNKQIQLDQDMVQKMPNQIKDKVAAAHKQILEGANPDGTPKDTPEAQARFKATYQAIYQDARKQLEPVHARMRHMGIDTSDLESEITGEQSEEDQEYGVQTTPEGVAPVPANHPAAQPKPEHTATPPQAQPPTAPPASSGAPAGMKLVGHANGKPVYQDAQGVYHY